MALTFRLKAQVPERLDLSGLTPAALAGKSLGEIAALVIGTTRFAPTVGDLFDLSGTPDDTIHFEGGSERFDGIGTKLAGGTIVVEGDAGARLGTGMKSGTITVAGSVGPHAATAMTGGRIEIGGDAGDFLGGAIHGAMAGQQGGFVLVRGRIGDRAGDRMKRGTIVSLTGVGADVGSRMSGGTIIAPVSGTRPGTLMKRGTLILAEPGELAPTFVDTGSWAATFAMLLKRWIAAEAPDAAHLVPLRARRYRGDMAAVGKGELLVGA